MHSAERGDNLKLLVVPRPHGDDSRSGRFYRGGHVMVRRFVGVYAAAVVLGLVGRADDKLTPS